MPTKEPDPLTPAEVEALFALAGFGPSKTARRNRAMLMVMHDAALRADETVNLKPADIDMATGTVTVTNGKGGKSRKIANCLDPDTKQALASWMALRETLKWDGRSAYLFGTFYARPGRGDGDNAAELRGGGRMDTSYLRRLLPKLAKRAKLKSTHPHLLRHTRARQWDEEGVSTEKIRRSLGHRSLHTTTIYLRGLSPADMGASERGRGAHA